MTSPIGSGRRYSFQHLAAALTRKGHCQGQRDRRPGYGHGACRRSGASGLMLPGVTLPTAGSRLRGAGRGSGHPDRVRDRRGGDRPLRRRLRRHAVHAVRRAPARVAEGVTQQGRAPAAGSPTRTWTNVLNAPLPGASSEAYTSLQMSCFQVNLPRSRCMDHRLRHAPFDVAP